MEMRCIASKPIHSHSGKLFREKGLSAPEVASRDCGWHGSGRPLGECTAGRHGLLHSTKNGCKRLSRWRAAATSACAGSERSQPRRGKVGGRARRRALCARCSRLVSQVSLRASRHARTHEHLLHHTAWTACSPHVLAGRRKAVELTYNGYLCLYKSCTVGFVGGASRGAMVCFGLLHVLIENDR